jgi:hypothetical protein
MRDRYHVKRSGLTGYWFVMQRGAVVIATRSKLAANALAFLLGSIA